MMKSSIDRGCGGVDYFGNECERQRKYLNLFLERTWSTSSILAVAVYGLQRCKMGDPRSRGRELS